MACDRFGMRATDRPRQKVLWPTTRPQRAGISDSIPRSASAFVSQSATASNASPPRRACVPSWATVHDGRMRRASPISSCTPRSPVPCRSWPSCTVAGIPTRGPVGLVHRPPIAIGAAGTPCSQPSDRPCGLLDATKLGRGRGQWLAQRGKRMLARVPPIAAGRADALCLLRFGDLVQAQTRGARGMGLRAVGPDKQSSTQKGLNIAWTLWFAIINIAKLC